LYKTDNDHRLVYEGESGSYLFPSLPVGISENDASENDASEIKENAGFRRLNFGSDDNVSTEFTVAFDTHRETPGDANSPVDTIEEQADEIRQQAYAKGFVDGEKAGAEAEKAKLKEVLETLYTAISELDSTKSDLYYDAEKQVVELGLMIARKIVCREVSIDKDTIFRVLKEALKKVSNQKKIIIKIHPADLQAIKDAELDVSSLIKTKGDVILEPDDAIGRGECFIETTFGVIDARIESQLQAMEESLRLALQDGAMERLMVTT